MLDRREQSPNEAGAGLNAVAGQGVQALHDDGADTMLVLPSDLPLMRASDLAEIDALGCYHPIVLCPDRHGVGTNAILLRGITHFGFQFGPGSLEVHRLAAQRLGIDARLHAKFTMACDLDEPSDIDLWFRHDAATAVAVLGEPGPVRETSDTAGWLPGDRSSKEFQSIFSGRQL